MRMQLVVQYHDPNPCNRTLSLRRSHSIQNTFYKENTFYMHMQLVVQMHMYSYHGILMYSGHRNCACMCTSQTCTHVHHRKWRTGHAGQDAVPRLRLVRPSVAGPATEACGSGDRRAHPPLHWWRAGAQTALHPSRGLPPTRAKSLTATASSSLGPAAQSFHPRRERLPACGTCVSASCAPTPHPRA